MSSEAMVPLSYEIQAFAYRNVLRIIKEKGCGYNEAWDIFKKEFIEKMTVQLDGLIKEDDNRQQNSNKSKMDGNRDQRGRLRTNRKSQRKIHSRDGTSEGA